jgi:hypothetical protein
MWHAKYIMEQSIHTLFKKVFLSEIWHWPPCQELTFHFGCTQSNELGPCRNIHSSIKKIIPPNRSNPLGVKGLGPIWAFWPITSDNSKPLRASPGEVPSGPPKIIYTNVFSVAGLGGGTGSVWSSPWAPAYGQPYSPNLEYWARSPEWLPTRQRHLLSDTG